VTTTPAETSGAALSTITTIAATRCDMRSGAIVGETLLRASPVDRAPSFSLFVADTSSSRRSATSQVVDTLAPAPLAKVAVSDDATPLAFSINVCATLHSRYHAAVDDDGAQLRGSTEISGLRDESRRERDST